MLILPKLLSVGCDNPSIPYLHIPRGWSSCDHINVLLYHKSCSIFLRNISDVNLFECGIAGGRHRGGRGHDSLAGTTVKVRQGPYKGYRGRVIDVKGTTVRVELESQMKVVTGMCWICSCELGKLWFFIFFKGVSSFEFLVLLLS